VRSPQNQIRGRASPFRLTGGRASLPGRTPDLTLRRMPGEQYGSLSVVFPVQPSKRPRDGRDQLRKRGATYADVVRQSTRLHSVRNHRFIASARSRFEVEGPKPRASAIFARPHVPVHSERPNVRGRNVRHTTRRLHRLLFIQGANFCVRGPAPKFPSPYLWICNWLNVLGIGSSAKRSHACGWALSALRRRWLLDRHVPQSNDLSQLQRHRRGWDEALTRIHPLEHPRHAVHLDRDRRRDPRQSPTRSSQHQETRRQQR
jgi:hypothetical protein